MCRHPALHVQSGADLKVGKWAHNGCELKLKLKKWTQDNVTKSSRWERSTRATGDTNLESSAEQVPRNPKLETGTE